MTDKDIVKKVEREIRDENRKCICFLCAFFMTLLLMLSFGGFFNPYLWRVCLLLIWLAATVLLTAFFTMALIKVTAAKEEGNDND